MLTLPNSIPKLHSRFNIIQPLTTSPCRNPPQQALMRVAASDLSPHRRHRPIVGQRQRSGRATRSTSVLGWTSTTRRTSCSDTTRAILESCRKMTSAYSFKTWSLRISTKQDVFVAGLGLKRFPWEFFKKVETAIPCYSLLYIPARMGPGTAKTKIFARLLNTQKAQNHLQASWSPMHGCTETRAQTSIRSWRCAAHQAAVW